MLRAEKEAIATAPDYEAIVKNLTEDKAELEAKVKQLGVVCSLCRGGGGACAFPSLVFMLLCVCV